MAKKKAAPGEVPVQALVQDVHEILDRVSKGKAVDVTDLQLVAAAAAGLRMNWLRGLKEAVGDFRVGTPEYEAFKNCAAAMLTILLQFGIISADEMQPLWMNVEAGRWED